MLRDARAPGDGETQPRLAALSDDVRGLGDWRFYGPYQKNRSIVPPTRHLMVGHHPAVSPVMRTTSAGPILNLVCRLLLEKKKKLSQTDPIHRALSSPDE